MVVLAGGKVYLKILLWGMASCGKTTILETLYKLTMEEKKEITPKSDLIKIDTKSGSTLYFDRCLFEVKNQKNIIYHVCAVAGRSSFTSLRKSMFKGTDGIIFVVDSQNLFIEDNIESLKELKAVAKEKLIKEIPLIVMLNKQDLKEIIGEEIIKAKLMEENLWYEADNKLWAWNPLFFKTCALYEQRKNIYSSFLECAKRTVIYQLYGEGKAPTEEIDLKKFKDKKLSQIPMP